MASSSLMRTPRSVDIELTHRCNLRCRYCGYFTSPANTGNDLPTQEWMTFFDELGRCGVMSLNLSGGEVFLREDILRLLEGIVENRMRFSIVSNGTLITKGISEEIAGTGRCNTIQISLDGSRPATHDSFRGKGSFSKAIKAINILIATGVPVTCRVTIHRKNVRDLDNIAHLLLDDLGLSEFSTNYVSYLGRSREFADEVCLTIEERVAAMESLLRLTRQYPGRIKASAGPLADARNYWAMDESLRSGKNPPQGGGFLAGCGSCYNKIAVRADGMYVPCNLLGHMVLGRINITPLEDVWQNSPDLIKFRERQTIPLSTFPDCRDCRYRLYCRGNCPATAFTLSGDVYAPSYEPCLKKFLEAGGRIIPI